MRQGDKTTPLGRPHRCVDLARTSEEEGARLWDLCSASEVDKEVIRREVCYSNSSACIVIKIGTADYSFIRVYLSKILWFDQVLTCLE